MSDKMDDREIKKREIEPRTEGQFQLQSIVILNRNAGNLIIVCCVAVTDAFCDQ
jgi:hypothetical protein